MNVLLVYPRYPDSFWSFRHALKFVGKKAAFPPLGLLTVAALFPETWETRLIDQNVRDVTDPDLAWADMVFVSAMTIQRDAVRDILARCRRLGVTTVAGGPLFTTAPEDFPEADHLVLGEAELTLPPFLDDLARGCAQRTYTASGRADLALTPLPRWELLDTRDYAAMNIQYSRGCPFDCEFCDITQLFGRRPRTKSREQLTAELDALHTRGWKGGVFFVDDNFIGDR
ncbi:partial Hopanoid C-2 methylase, partial [Anaerolineae bacterium]